MTIRLGTDNPSAALVVLVDGKYVDRNGRPHVNLTGNVTDYPQWEFPPGKRELVVWVQGLAPGLHTITVRSGGIGTSLPRVNDQTITFVSR